jgi:hypothetical protein
MFERTSVKRGAGTVLPTAIDVTEAKPAFSLAFIQSRLEWRALADPAFREFALRNAQSAFRELTGFDWPAGFSLTEANGRIDVLIPAACFKHLTAGVAVVDTPKWRMVVHVDEGNEDQAI